MARSYLLFTLLIVLSSCGQDSTYELKLSDEDFQSAFLEMELAKEAARTASLSIQDSLMNEYFVIIAKEFNLTIDELKTEVRERLSVDEDFEAHYDALKIKIDSLQKSKPKIPK